MSIIDWLVLIGTLVFITWYGIRKSRGSKNIEGYLLGNKTLPWYTVGLSIMATQASAITFLSAPGQAFTDGMRFIQFYFGLPLAMVVLSITVVPIFHRLKVFTAYEYLENRFDLKTRSLGAFLFLIQRSLAAGLTIYAPAIILSSLLGWNIYLTNICIGGIVIIYTVAGGTKAVSYTQTGQMVIILSGMALAGIILFRMLPDSLSFGDVITIAGHSNKLNLVDTSLEINNRYNLWSGLIGGFFLALSYFGTDQSQVGRYLSGSSITQSRLGLLFNGIVKIPMQMAILFIGALLYVFYMFVPQPVFFNSVETNKLKNSAYASEYYAIESEFNALQSAKRETTLELLDAVKSDNSELIAQKKEIIRSQQKSQESIRNNLKVVIKENDKLADTNDVNYIFLRFVTDYLPVGIIGLIIAVIFAASMSSTSSELNALASTFVVDIYKRSLHKEGDSTHYLNASRWATIGWGVFAIGIAMFAGKLGSLIEAVNILGSIFYGTILGIFLTGFYLKHVKGNAVFIAAVIAECVVIVCYNFTEISFLWYNVIGCLLVMILAMLIQSISKPKTANP
ncbi:MAG: sodium:solute symporter [Bacteroidia bacterium]|nr:sodium:solute symporter [Bacteroidia bacterium]